MLCPRIRQPRVTLFLAAALAALSLASGRALADLPAQATILSSMTTANNYFLAEWPTAGSKNGLPSSHASDIWTRATYMNGAMALYRTYLGAGLSGNATTVYNYAVSWGTNAYTSTTASSPTAWCLFGGDNTSTEDNMCAGQAYIELYQADPTQTARLTHIAANLIHMAPTYTNNPASISEKYVDAIHMALPGYAKYAALNLSGNPTPATLLAAMYSFYHNHKTTNSLYDTTDHLWYRGYSGPDYRYPTFKTPTGLSVTGRGAMAG
jgi:hypothetical protein